MARWSLNYSLDSIDRSLIRFAVFAPKLHYEIKPVNGPAKIFYAYIDLV